MKKTAILIMLLACATAAMAQTGKRELTVTVSDSKGKPTKGLELFLYIEGDNSSLIAADGSRPVTFMVAEGDILNVVNSTMVYKFEVDGISELELVFKNKSKLDGYKDNRNNTINTGYQVMNLSDNPGSAAAVDMALISTYNDIASYLDGRIAGVEVIRQGGKVDLRIRGRKSIPDKGDRLDTKAKFGTLDGGTSGTNNNLTFENQNDHASSGFSDSVAESARGESPLVIVDGVEMGDFNYVNSMLPTSVIASITVLKDGGKYGVRGGAGVVVITTKTGGEHDE